MLHRAWAPTPNYSPGRGGNAPAAIVLHTTDGTFDGTVRWFAQADSGVSAHYLVGLDGRVVQFVQDADTARHAGAVVRPTMPVAATDDPNVWTIGIEFDDGRDPHSVVRPDAQYDAGAELLDGIAARWRIPLDRAHVVGHREINASKTCPGNLDIDRLLAAARLLDASSAGAAAESRQTGIAPRLVCLLPVRNGAQDLPDWFASVERFADAVVALGDGSTDETAELLAAHPLVEVLLRNPRRETYAGWDDAANRARLLEAAAGADPDWVLWLDADERIPADDAAALRTFIATDALPGCAYGLRCFRMWEGGCDPMFVWVYRLFAYRHGQSLPKGPLHFDPIPTDVPRAAFVHTTLRVQHWGAATDDARLARLAKYREADPDGRYPTNFGRIDEVPASTVRWPARGAEPSILPRDDAATETDRRPRVVCLLPARNAADDLPGWFESVARFADAVVALDDGSTDDTAAVLDAHPLVEVLLRNPRREGYAEWDDAANRNRLLPAAAALAADWIMSLDADERITPDDAAALREFIDRDALPGLAYGFRVFRMVDGPDTYDRDSLWVYRLFAFAPGQVFPDQQLHFVPIPTTIPRARWLRTTVRIQHLASLTDAHRRARYEKYRVADPDRRYQADYSHLLSPPVEPARWEPRPPDLPVLHRADDAMPIGALEELALAEAAFGPELPLLSAIVISRDDEDCIERSVRSVVEQQCDEPFEVIVVTSGSDRTAEIVRGRFPDVRVVELDHPALPGEARNAGLRVARGEYVSFPGSHVELPPGSLDARIKAHDAGWGMVSGTTLNGTPTRAGWASYFLDHSTVLPGRPSEPFAEAPMHCSYLRHLLLEAGGFPEHLRAGEDTVVNLRLFRQGHTAYRAADVTLVHRSPCRSVARLVRHHFIRGRGLTRVVGGRVRAILRGYLARRLGRIDRNVAAWGGELQDRYREVRPLVRLGLLAAWLGAHYEVTRSAVAARRRGTSDVSATAVPPAPIADAPLTKPLRTRTAATERTSGRARPIFVHVPKTAGTTLERILEREAARLVGVGASGAEEPGPATRTQPLLRGAPDRRIAVNDRAPRPDRGEPRYPVVFPHIPRTAGTTLSRVISREYGYDQLLWLYGYRPAEDLGAFEQLPTSRKHALRAAVGHMEFGFHRLLARPAVYITLLREPVDRIISHYHYLLRTRERDRPVDVLHGVRSLEGYVDRSPAAPLFNNGQTRLVGGDLFASGQPATHETLARAKANLNESFAVVGLTERFDESLLLMRSALGWGWPVYARENVNRERPNRDETPVSTVEAIVERNQLDIELYEYATELFERRVRNHGRMREELEILGEMNRSFQKDPEDRGPVAPATMGSTAVEPPERRRDGADISAGTTLRLSYPTSAENRPRYGYGRPHHARLARLLAAHDATYRLELERLGGLADALVAIPRDPTTPDAPHWLNTWFTGLDAVSLYGFMRLRSPRRYVEVGSGHSTRFAAQAKRDGELGTEIISIDRAPRVPIDALCDRIVRAPLELVDLGLFGDLESGDLVLIDGSHRVFMNSDVVTFYLDVLPELPNGVLVGIHDIHWPIDYPPDLRGAYLSEQYLFGALLLGEPSWLQPVLACSYVAQHPELGDVLAPLWGQPQLDGVERQGSLFWFAIER